jgi:hypothetical protein
MLALTGCARLLPGSAPDAPGAGPDDLRTERPGSSDRAPETSRQDAAASDLARDSAPRDRLLVDQARPKDQELVDQAKPKDQELVDQLKPPLDQGALLSPCPATAQLSGWRPRLAWTGAELAVLRHRTVAGVTQTHLALLDASLALVKPDLDLQDDGAANAQDGHLVAGPAGALGALWLNASPPQTLAFQRVAAGSPVGANLILGGYWPAIAYNSAALEYALFEADSVTRVSATTGVAHDDAGLGDTAEPFPRRN